mmetsp:Transcript_35636/g.44163  ORF Transcript_35636/g.44163 Transcript_35636/m.44163 type:complete len:610 (-) Transcript_35636:53-1882(-)
MLDVKLLGSSTCSAVETVAAAAQALGPENETSKMFTFSLKTGTWIRYPYRHGFIGPPQPFEVSHGEWGPPINKTSVIDWEPYCAWLILCDLLLTVTWLKVTYEVPKNVRLKWFSSTFRFSIGNVYGFLRMSLIIYLFRGKPKAIYQYIAVISFVFLCFGGLIALLFEEGPFKSMRPNSVGVYEWENPLNPCAVMPAYGADLWRRFEYRIWGLIQDFTKSRRRVVKRMRSWSGFELAPAETTISDMFDIGLNNMNRFKDFACHLVHDGEKENLNSESVPDHQPKKNQDSQSYCLRPPISPLRNLNMSSRVSKSQQQPNVDLPEQEFESAPKAYGRRRSLEAADELPQPKSFVPTESEWSLEKFAESFTSDEITLIGPAKVKIKVSKEKWNEALLYWAMPSLNEYFSKAIGYESFSKPQTFRNNRLQYLDLHRPKSINRSERKRFSPRSPSKKKQQSNPRLGHWSALEDFVDTSQREFGEDYDDMGSDDEGYQSYVWSPPVRGTITIRTDGVIFSINPSPPSIREVLKLVNNKNAQTSPRHVVVELIGRRVVCKYETRMMFMFAEYRAYGLRLNLAQRKTLLWLMNVLNKMNPKEKNLRCFRAPNFSCSNS